MSLEFTYDGAPLAADVKPSTVSLPQRAEGGEPSIGVIPIEEGDALTGHRPFIVEEDDCAQPRLFTGWTVERDYARQAEGGLIVADQRLTDVNIVDCNAALNFRVIWDTDGNRPEETWQARLTWLLGSDYLSGLVSSDETWIVTNTVAMDAADYRGAFPMAVLEDLRARSGDAYNFYLFWDSTASEVRLFFDNEGEVWGACPLTISNVESDVDGSTCFAPDMVAKLAREPDQTYSEVIVNFNGGKVYRSLATTAATFIRRGTTIERPYTKRASTAVSQADAWLVKHSVERDRITCVMRSVPPESVGLVRAGQSLDVRFSHLPGYEGAGFTTMRIVACSPVPVSDVPGALYDISLELLGPAPDVETEPLSASLFRHGDCSGSLWGDGARRVGFGSDGDNPPSGFVAEPLVGAVEYLPFGGLIGCGSSLLSPGFKLTADAIVNIDSRGRFAGVSSGSSSITISLRQNGTIIDSVTATDNRPPGLQYWGGMLDLVKAGIDAADGDEFELGCVFTDWGGFPEYEYSPADGQQDTHFRITGASGPTTTGTTIEPPTATPTTVVTTTDPTVDDDSEHGYSVGDIWVNTTSDDVFILVDATPGSAVWQLIGGGTTDHGDLTGLADDDHTQYVLKTDGGKEVVSTVAAAGATETLDLADGNVHDVTLDADCTLTFAGATNGVACSFTLVLRQDGTGGWTTTWPGSVVWAGGSAPTLDETASSVSVLTFFSLDGGTVWYGFSTGGGGNPATTVESETTWGISPAVGSDTEYARQDHTHGSPPEPAGELLVADGTTGPNGSNTSSYVEEEDAHTTTSGTLEDIPDVSTTITLQRTAHISAWLNTQISGSGVCVIGIAVNIDGTDHDEVQHAISGSDAATLSVVHRTATELAPGTYTVKGRMRRVSGASTPSVDRADLLVMSMGHSGPVLLTNEAEDDYLYADL